ncbi:MAG TPA: ATP-binding protein [Pyrinomonadaceae bacterium]|nr:ATP-binding protein [Pyrinomonadaceae bacterium]
MPLPRQFLSVILCIALGIVFFALLIFQSPPAAFIALAFALGGALAGRFLTSDGRHELPSGEVATAAITQEKIQSAKLAARAAARADAVPASELLDAMMNSMREGMLVVDGEMRVVLANQAARSLFGFSEGTSQSLRLGDLTRNPAVLSAYLGAVERGERIEAKVEMMEADKRIFDLRVAPLQERAASAAQSTRGAVGVFFDITRLERLERVRQEFLSNVSHELRTPLTAIRAFVETLEDGAIDDEEHNRRFLSIIDRNAARMHSLIDDILELSAIEAGTVTVAVSPVRLRSMVNDVLTSLAARAGERKVSLENEIGEEVVVYADARRLEQMLTNLADNAIKFNPEGGAVRVHHERAGGRDRVLVSDTGEGIAPEHIRRIFERFYRVDRARSRALGGTGLGLAIVKHLARAHGGEATVQSIPGQGSTFIIELPFKDQPEDGSQPY